MRPNTLVIGYYRDEVCVDQLMVSVAYRAHKVSCQLLVRKLLKGRSDHALSTAILNALLSKAADRSWKRNVSQTDFDDFDGVATCFPGLEDVSSIRNFKT